MKTMIAIVTLASAAAAATSLLAAEKEDRSKVPGVMNFKMKSLAGEDVDLAKYQGKVLLIVNTASECGFTPQYEALEALHEKYAEQGLVVLGFPANEFGAQEPGTNEEIANFCKENYGVQFDMFAKVVVRGDKICPLYKHLTSKETDPDFAGDINWNFEKFVIDRNGKIVARYKSAIPPDGPQVVKRIESELAKKSAN